MNAKRRFGALLARLREEAGYRSARAFHEAHGDALGCSLKACSDAEAGRALPQPALAERLAAALRLGLEQDRAGEYARAYLEALLGSAAFLEFAGWALREPPQRRGRARDGAGPADGKVVLDHPFLLRASEAELSSYLPYLDRAVDDAAAAAGTEKDGEDYVLEARVTRLIAY